MSRLLAVDASSVFMRALSVLPEDKRTLEDLEYMTIGMLRKAVNRVQPDYLVVALDTVDKCWRYDIHPEYKNGRDYPFLRPRQLTPMLRPCLERRNMAVAYQEGMEADDLLHALARKANPETEVFIYTRDSDLFVSLWRDGVNLLWPHKGGELEVIDRAKAEEKLGYNPAYLPGVRALTADTKDNLRGLLHLVEPLPKGWRCPVTKARAVAILQSYSGDVWSVIEAACSWEEMPVEMNDKEQAFIARFADGIGAIYQLCRPGQPVALTFDRSRAPIGGVDLRTGVEVVA